MSAEISAVRLASVLPSWIANQGVEVWCGPSLVAVLGKRVIGSSCGPSRDGSRTVFLTFVQDRGRQPVDLSTVKALDSWADEWFALVGACGR
jgi:hypothetical protein